MSSLLNRIIGSYSGTTKGPLFICIGGIHGNEPAGVLAIEQVCKMLNVEPSINPDFDFCGTFVGIRGNRRALADKKRFMRKDLNRQWHKQHIDFVFHCPEEKLDEEDLELKELVLLIDDLIEKYQPDSVFMVDIHTTSATGGIFTIVTDDPVSQRIAKQLFAPVILGMLEGLSGTTLHYFTSENLGIKASGLSFEAGQHDDPASVDNAVSAIIECFRALGCVKPVHVESKHDLQLMFNSKNLPNVARLIDKHSLKNRKGFFMIPGYENFQPVKRGEVLAFDDSGVIRAQTDAMILMPFYQRQGEDGFFLIEEES